GPGQAGKPRLAPTELPALLVAAASAPATAPLTPQAYNQVLSLFYQPEAKAQAGGDLVLRRLLARVMARRGTADYTIHQPAYGAHTPGLNEFPAAPLKPPILGKLEAPPPQPPDLNRLLQVPTPAGALDLGGPPPRLKAAARKVAEGVAASA